MPTKKSPVKAGKVNVTRVHERKGKTVVAESGSTILESRVFDSAPATATGLIGITIEVLEYNFLKLSAGGELPCTVQEFGDGTGHRELFKILRREIEEQLPAGKRWVQEKANE